MKHSTIALLFAGLSLGAIIPARAAAEGTIVVAII